jgi:phospholipid/cholesterol/gamma-HCH transport system permease protein
MKIQQPAETSISIDTKKPESGGITARIRGRMDYHSAPLLIRDIIGHIHRHKPAKLAIDLEQVTYFDDFGTLVLSEVEKAFENGDSGITISDPNCVADNSVSFTEFDRIGNPSAVTIEKAEHIFEKIGGSAIIHADSIKGMVSFLGSVFIALLKIISHPRSLRVGDTILIMEKTGVNALPIVAMISFLLGLVIAFMSSLQLQQFGANIYVASLVAIGMVSELGPIMTAIVVSGRSGSAFAAEIGTMKISEEIDALTTMGFDPISFLALPRVIASMIVVPILTLLSNIFAILGGLTVGVFLLDLTFTSYISQSLDSLTLFEIFWGLMKSFVFAVLISMVGCLRGFQAKGGADAVGNAATSAVVSGVFLIILFDSFFAVLRSYWW